MRQAHANPPDTPAPGAPVPPFEAAGPVVPASHLDELVFARLRRQGIRHARLCSDAVFLRRACLDITGTLPTPDEARRFPANPSPTRRRDLVDALLQRDTTADLWAMRWCDLLRVKSEFPIDLWPNAVQAYHRWVRTALRDNLRFDRFARELLTTSGSNFRAPQVNFYRAIQGRTPEAIAQAVALTFMGVRTRAWKPERLAGMAAFFAQIGYKPTGEWKEEIVLHDPHAPAARKAARPVFPDGTPARLQTGQDPREVFAAWLTAPGNPWFARCVVNRVWCWLLGRGIVHEPDDLRPDNPPSNPELLAWLERTFIASGYDLRQLIRTVCTSTVYQLSSIPASSNPAAEAGFAHYPLRRLEAEVLIDALNQITGATETYSSPIPEPFTFIPEDQRAISLADGSITSPFLEMFGRPARDTGMAAERSGASTAAQELHLLNSSHIQRKVQRSPALLLLARFSRTRREVVDGVYLAVLSRLPTDAERDAVAGYAGRGAAAPRDLIADLAWALINSPEFLFKH